MQPGQGILFKDYKIIGSKKKKHRFGYSLNSPFG